MIVFPLLRSSCSLVVCAGFRVDRVPADLDAVVIGSGVGGLTAAALLAKAGKRVLVLEQHDQAGGCTHTFENKGFEFDVGKVTHTTSVPQNHSTKLFNFCSTKRGRLRELCESRNKAAINRKSAPLYFPTHMSSSQ